jgi:ABC-type Fe3+/spermidine/putrescine transport system ATPase subunit
MAEAVLEFRNVSKRFNQVNAVDQVSFSIFAGEVFTLLGPSGCGKTTTLRLVAGLEEPDQGEILINGSVVAAPKHNIFTPSEKRHLGMVFQSYAIWPHLTGVEKVAFPLRARGESTGSIKQRVLQALDTVGLAGLDARGATELSGGQQQRVALARALVYAPAILLLDEPLSNLDAKLREQMRLEIRGLQGKLNLTVLYVTHDQSEAMALSDRIAVVRGGRFEQVGSPAEVYETPASGFVADFLGRTVSFEGTVGRNHFSSWVDLVNDGGRIVLREERLNAFTGGESIALVMRPEDIDILPNGEREENQLAATVQQAAYLGDHFEYHVAAGGLCFILRAPKKQQYAAGAEVRLKLDPERIHARCLGA